MTNSRQFDEAKKYFELDWYCKTFSLEFASQDDGLKHYYDYGEKFGYWPNKIFNPDFYQLTHGLLDSESPLNHFINVGRFAKLSPCRFFDFDWYQNQNPDYVTENDGVLHYLRKGIFERRDPCPWLDMIAVSRTSKIVDIPDVIYRIESGLLNISNISGITLNTKDLAAHQRGFLSRIVIEKVKSVPAFVHGRNLVVLQAASLANCWRWLDFHADRNWDLLVNCYHGDFPHAHQAEHVFTQNGTKFTGIFNIWRHYGEILDLYDYVFLLDDDILCKHEDIDLLFSTANAHSLDIAQPSLSDDSYCSWPVFKRKTLDEVRLVNGVEIMMPVISRRARELWLPYFMLSISGFGLDLLPQLLKLKAGVVDAVEVKHLRAINQSDGEYYEFLRQNNINAKAELARIISLYKIKLSLHELDFLGKKQYAYRNSHRRI